MSQSVTSRKPYDLHRYALEDFDTHLCLRPPWVLLVVALFLARDYLFPLAGVASRLSGSGLDMGWAHDIQMPAWFLLELPVVLVLVAWARRAPAAGRLVRWIWLHGFWLLNLSLLLQVGAIVIDGGAVAVRGGYLPPGSMLVLVLLALCMAYLWLSKRVRHAFSDFPDAHAVT